MKLKALKAAFPQTIPIFTGFCFLGLAYGISMLDKYKGMGWKKFYLIFGMCDESFSINCSAEIPEDVDKGWFMFFVTLLNQFYRLPFHSVCFLCYAEAF